MNDTPGNTTQTMEIAELDTQRLPLSDVAPHPQNPRIHSDRQIKELQASLTEHGYAAGSMTVQRSTMRLVKGHGIYEALLGIGCVEADFVVVDMDDAEALLFLARDNRLSDLSSFDVPKLKAITVELQKIDVPLERIGFSEDEFVSLDFAYQQREADNSVGGQSAEDLWEGMPEFEQENITHRTIYVHFLSPADVNAFAELIGQEITDNMRFLWHPKAEKVIKKDYVCDDEP